jgi:hypothetical protein
LQPFFENNILDQISSGWPGATLTRFCFITARWELAAQPHAMSDVQEKADSRGPGFGTSKNWKSYLDMLQARA